MPKSSGIVIGLVAFQLLVALEVATPQPRAAEPNPPIAELADGWSYRRGDSPVDEEGVPLWAAAPDSRGWSAPTDSNQPLWTAGERYLWQRVPLPPTSHSPASLFLNGPFLYFDVYLDETRIYRYGNPDRPSLNKSVATPWHLISLSSDYREYRYLYVRSYSPYYLIGINGDVWLGTPSQILSRMFREDVGRLMVAALSASVGIIGLTLLFWRGTRRQYAFFALFALAIAVYVIQYTRVKQLLFGPSAIWTYLWASALLLIPIGLFGFLQSVFGPRSRKPLRTLRWVYTGALLPALALIIFFPFGIGQFVLIAVRLMNVASMIAVVVLTIHALRHQTRDALPIAIGLGALVLSGLHDVAIAFELLSLGRPIVHLGMLVFVAGVAVTLSRRIAATYDRTERYAREIKRASDERLRLMDELHDGVGAIMTNIGLLADTVNHRRTAPPDVLTTVSRLARAGLTEIRVFMRSLDDEERDWTAVVAELRQHGQAMLQPFQIAFRLEADIDPEAPHLTPFQYLTISRVFREALTNVTKHAHATAVVAHVSTGRERTVITIFDDGVGYERAPRSKEGGHGISAMRRRMADIGGNFHIEEDSGTQVRFEMPLRSAPPENTQPGRLRD